MKQFFIRKIMICTLILQFILQGYPVTETIKASGPEFGNTYIKPYPVGTKRYAVGFMSYEIWTNSSGVWTTKMPGDSVSQSELSYTYTFSFPGRSVKGIRVINFNSNSADHITYFSQSRSTDDYLSYAPFFSKTSGAPVWELKTPLGQSDISFSVGLAVQLAPASADGQYWNVIKEKEAEGITFAPGVEARRYYYPILFEIELYGQTEVNYFSRDGTRIAPTETIDMTVGRSYPPAPKAISGFTYANQYKKTTDGSPPSGTGMLSGQPSFTYDGSFDTYRINYYYDKAADGIAYIRHVDRNGNAIPGLIDRQEELVSNQPFTSTAPPAPASYKYAGYLKTTSGTPLADFSNPTPAPAQYPPIVSYNPASFTTLYLYYVYDVISEGKWHVRHMVKTGTAGTYKLMNENTIPITSLPNSRTEYADARYGTVLGHSVGFTGYKDSPTSTSNNAYASVSASSPEAYITFFYQGKSSFMGDFDVIPPNIAYRDTFTLHPKNYELNGCTYTGHQWKIERNGLTYVTPLIVGMTQNSVYTSSNYPSVIGSGTHYVSMRISTNCGDSDWIGPKTLTVSNPPDNNPPVFQVAWVRPSEPLKPVHEVLEGERLNLVVIQDPTVPTPTDPDGDDLTFDGFDFSDSTDWAKQIPNRFAAGYMSYTNVKMDEAGYHHVKASMRDEFGATSTASAFVNVIPPNPIAVITGPKQVVENRPLPNQFDANGSYSPVGRAINHTRDEWTNLKTVYTTPGKEIVKLDVYDSIGLKSVTSAEHVLTVLEDMPPVVELKGAVKAVRGVPFPYTVNAASPDGDTIVSKTVSIRYDSNNNGSFTDEAAASVTLDSNNKFDRSYTKVGKYQYTVCATEDWGQSACITVIADAVNDAPTVSFDVSSTVTEPSLVSVQPIKASDILHSTSWRNTDWSDSNKPKAWSVHADGSLTAVPYNVGAYSNYRSLHSANRIVEGYNQTKSFAESLGDEYYAETDRSGLYKIYISQKGVYGVPNFRQSGTFNGFAWTNEALVSVDLFNRIVVTVVRGNGIGKYAYYRLDSFVNPAGQPYKLEDINGSFIRSVPGFNLINGEDAGGHYMIQYPWGSGSGRKVYTTCVMALTCATGVSASSSYFGNYAVMQYKPADYSSSNVYLVDVRNGFNRVLTSQAESTNWIMSMDERYVLFRGQKMDRGWVINDTATGALTNASVDWNSTFMGRFNDYLLLKEMYGSTVRGYKFTGPTAIPLWTTSIELTAEITNDGKVYGFTRIGNDLLIQKLDIRTGAVNDLASIHTGGRGSVSVQKIKQTSDNELQVDVYFWDADKFVTYWIKGNSIVDNEPLGTFNQLISSHHLDNLQLQYGMQLNDYNSDQEGAGFSYRIQNNTTYYSVEQTARKIQLVKVRSGWREIIGSADMPVEDHAWNSYKIVAQNDRHRIYVNNVPVIDVRDGEFRGGGFGPHSSSPKAMFKGMSYADLNVTGISTEYHNVAIVGTSVKYNDSYSDPEKDPAIKQLTSWKYHKIADNFLNAGDGRSGASALDGRTFAEPQQPFDKVGTYRVMFSTMDDPHQEFLYANATFGSYRQASNEYTADVIVHRAPLARFALLAQTDGTIQWTDYSYDPDRYLSPTSYSREATGIDYLRTKGILEKKFYYITPSGATVREKLVAPQELGKYEVGMAVRDEYGAWSDYYIQYIDTSKVAVPNTPPVPGFTSAYINTFRNVPIVFNSTAYDREDGGREKLPHEYYIRNLTAQSTESLQSASRTSWTKTFNTVGTFNVRQVVEDSLGVSAQYELQLTIHNRLPVVNVTAPSSTDQTNPSRLGTLRPAFNWTFADSDNDAQKQYQLRIYRYGGVLQADTNVQSGSAITYTSASDLPERVNMYVVVRVNDGYDWSDWSSPKFFYIETNRPPAADFDWLPKPVWEGDALQLFNRSTDPDGDNLTSKWTVVTPSAQVLSYNSDPVMPNAIPGVYAVTLEVSDGRATAAIMKEITVAPLTIEADIRHTEDWKRTHDREGHETRNNPKDFYAGEVMLTSARTIPGAQVQSVKVKLAAKGLDGTDLSMDWRMHESGAHNRYETEIAEPRWSSLQSGLPRGTYELQFIAVYMNGVTKTTKVPFHIIGTIQETVEVHRRQ